MRRAVCKSWPEVVLDAETMEKVKAARALEEKAARKEREKQEALLEKKIVAYQTACLGSEERAVPRCKIGTHAQTAVGKLQVVLRALQSAPVVLTALSDRRRKRQISHVESHKVESQKHFVQCSLPEPCFNEVKIVQIHVDLLGNVKCIYLGMPCHVSSHSFCLK